MGNNTHSKRKQIKKRMTQAFGADGVHACGRVGGFGGIIALALYIAACMTFEWSKTSELGNAEDGTLADVGLQHVGKAEFGLIGYCLGTEIPGFSGDDTSRVCFDYRESVSIVNGNETSKMTGCERFSTGVLRSTDPCKRRDLVIVMMTFAILSAFTGDVISEKVKLNGMLLMVSFGLSLGAIIVWVDMNQNFESSKALKPDLGLILVICGSTAAFISSIMCLVDSCCCSDGDTPPMCNFKDDGVGMSGRIGAILAVATWTLLLAAITTSDWSRTTKLGEVGKFCGDPAVTGYETGCIQKATFGLWKYCLEPHIEQYGNETYPVCFEWDEVISTPGNIEYGGNVSATTASGIDRFSDYDAEAMRQLVGWGVIASIGAVVVGDIYSEKLWMCTILNFCAAGGGIFCMIMWVAFTEDIALDTDARMVTGRSGWFLVAGWIGAFVTAFFYGKDWLCNMRFVRPEEKKDKKKKKKDNTVTVVVKGNNSDEEDA